MTEKRTCPAEGTEKYKWENQLIQIEQLAENCKSFFYMHILERKRRSRPHEAIEKKRTFSLATASSIQTIKIERKNFTHKGKKGEWLEKSVVLGTARHFNIMEENTHIR